LKDQVQTITYLINDLDVNVAYQKHDYFDGLDFIILYDVFYKFE